MQRRSALCARKRPFAMTQSRNVALIVAAGQGVRAGGSMPKQFVSLGGKPVIARAVDAFLEHNSIDAVFVVIGAGQESMLRAAVGAREIAAIVVGGANRIDSVRNGIEAIASTGGATNILIHDAARPCVPADVIDRLLSALTTSPCAVPVMPVNDTLAGAGDSLGDVVDRTSLVRVQTPQAARFDAALTSHQRWQGGVATDDAQMFRAAGYHVALVEGDTMLEKITQPDDFAVAEARLTSRLISRTGYGFDVHRFETGRPLWLCGVEVAHDQGLAGHSDADVALHALVDALLGAKAAGDIGDHFPPSDQRWKNAASDRFLEHARDIATSDGGIIDHVDITIICETPKIGPYRSAMQIRIATLLALDIRQVSIKATTTERLGFTGRGEGIAAQAIATIRSHI